MTKCPRCDEPATVGVLCDSHAKELAETCPEITAEQVRATVTRSAPGSLVDQWGRPHALASTTTVGRSRDSAIAILDPSVSNRHAQLRLRDGGWVLHDLGSLNGCWIAGDRVREHALSSGEPVRFGSVSMLFVSGLVETPDESMQTGPGQTVPQVAGDRFRVRLRRAEASLELLSQDDGGRLVAAGASLFLTALEFALVRRLVEQRLLSGDVEHAFVSSQTLLRTLDFRSVDADGDNLRQLVRRVRKKASDALDIRDLVESRKGVGYEIGWRVERL